MEGDDYKRLTVDWYRRRLDAYGPGIQALSSGTEPRRALRFEVLTGVGIVPGSSVLDVGCGFADYFSFLRDAGIAVDYTGVDLVPELVERAMADHPGLNVSVRDLQRDPFADASFDFVVCSQTFNLRFGDGDNTEIVRDMLRRMFASARHGVAIDFVTDWVDFREDYLVYRNPEDMFRFAKSLTRRVVLRHDYPLFEFCLYLYPDFAAWGPAR
jgi:SAM-dependent methyltransferase